MRQQGKLSLVVLVMLFPAGCGLPRDAEHTRERVEHGTLRVGAVMAPPWTIMGRGNIPAGIEVDLVNALAQELDATVEWRIGGDSQLMAALERYELDLVIGGIIQDSAWSDRVGFTQPYFTSSGEHIDLKESRTSHHVMAVPPGENGWLLLVDQFLQVHRPTNAEIVHQAGHAHATPGGVAE